MSDVTVQDEPQKKVGEAPPAKKESAPSGESASPADQGIKKSQSSWGDCVFNENITIFPGNRLPQYDKGPVKAYAARGTDKAPPNLFALVCEEHLTPRTMKAGNYAAIINPSLVRLIASGPAYWEPAGKEKYCFVYENTAGYPVMKDDTRGGLGLKTDVVMSAVIRPMIGVLQDMRDKDIVHGNIRPSNIFDGGSKRIERVVLGECLSMPVSYNQSVLYEPIDRALCNPIGRGPGTLNDDLYSFGVCLAVMLRNYDPTENMSDEEIIERKMEEGTYATLLGKDRLTGGILELMRGLLYDDEAQRWTLDDILVWLDGRRLSPKQAVRRVKANRPISFNHGKYTRPELLARDIGKNVAEIRKISDDGELEQWLERALEDKVTTAHYETALKLAEEGGRGPGYPERLATRISIALHPEGPIRYKTISVYPEGIGPALSESFIMKKDLQTYTDFFMIYFITQWVDSQSRTVPDAMNLVGRFDSARAFLRQKNFGSGLEKCIYLLNPEIHCLSEKLSKFQVRTPEELMVALEKISALSSRPAMFFDRHISAFLSVKDRKNIDPYLHDMGSPELHRRMYAELMTLATIQKRSQMPPFPGIASWVVENLEPMYERFHDRMLRKELKKKAEKSKEAGDLTKIAAMFNSPSIYSEDNMNFRKSMRSYYELEKESRKIEYELRDEATMGRDTGRQIAAVVAGVISAIIILVTAFSSMHGHAAPF